MHNAVTRPGLTSVQFMDLVAERRGILHWVPAFVSSDWTQSTARGARTA